MLFAASVLLMSASSEATPRGKLVATCSSSSGEEKLTLCIFETPWVAQKSYDIYWSKTATSCDFKANDKVIMRTFSPSEINTDDVTELSMKQSNRFLFWGDKTKFEYDRVRRSASLKLVNGRGLFIWDTGPKAPSEPRGRFHYEFDSCKD